MKKGYHHGTGHAGHMAGHHPAPKKARGDMRTKAKSHKHGYQPGPRQQEGPRHSKGCGPCNESHS